MPYWFEDPLLKSLSPLMKASSVKGINTVFGTPKVYMGDNVLSTAVAIAPTVWDALALRCVKKRAFIVTDEGAARFAARIAAPLQSRQFTVETWDKAQPEAPLDSIQAGAEAASKFEPDVIVAVGGGSAMDTAKAVFMLYERPDITDVGMVSPLMPLNLRKKAILVAIPTTSGTGSECTPALVASDTRAHRKIPVLNIELVPDIAILVPSFTTGMPPKLTAGTGLDALAHATDCVTSPTSGDFSEPLALRSIEMIFRWLPRAYREGADLEARSRMHLAACLSGMAFANGGISLTHSMGHSLGHLFNMHHGIAVGVFIPYTLQYYATISDRFLPICDSLKVKGRTRAAKLDGLVGKVKGLMKELDVPTDLKSMGISRDEFKQKMGDLVQFSLADPDGFQSPRPVNEEQYEKLFWYTYEGKDVDF
jgi:alcohol dehydrogenase class IV